MEKYRLLERVWMPTYRYELETSHRTGSQSWRSIPGQFVHAPEKLRTVGDYSTLAEAESGCRIREAHARLSANLFQYGGPTLFFQSSLSPSQFRKKLSCVGLTPPKTEDSAALADWWKDHHNDWSPQQREAVWEACDKIEFFTVSSRNPASQVYVVVEATWSWDDDSFNADSEGGLLRYAFRSRETAEAYRQMLEEDARRSETVKLAGAGRDAYIENHVNPRARFPTLPAESVPLSNCPLYEVVEIEWNQEHDEH